MNEGSALGNQLLELTQDPGIQTMFKDSLILIFIT